MANTSPFFKKFARVFKANRWDIVPDVAWRSYLKNSKTDDLKMDDVYSARYVQDGQRVLDRNGLADDITHIKSTAVQKAYYDADNQELQIMFVGGNQWYTYPNVPQDVAEDFFKAFSKGRAVHDILQPYADKSWKS